METNNIIYSRLDNFIKDYYKVQLIKGVLLSLSFVFLFFLLVVLGEYFFNFSSKTRTFLFYFLFIFYFVLFLYFILLPTLKVFKITKGLSYREAAQLISGKFIEIDDKLINLLELIGLQNKNAYSHELTLAAIQQKNGELQNISFAEALDKKRNFSLLKYFSGILFLFLLILIINPQIITQSTQHLIQHEKEFVYKPVLNFELLNQSLSVENGKDFLLKVKVSGDFFPSDLKINVSGNSFFMNKQSKNEFEYEFKSLNNSLAFYFSTGDYASQTFRLEVLPTPLVNKMNISVVPPSYTGEEPRLLSNAGDLTVLSGSLIRWEIETFNANELYFKFNDSLQTKAEKNENFFNLTRRFVKSEDYSISVKNDFFDKANYLKFSIKVIPDMFPAISMEKLNDSTNYLLVYFRGNISDDYGFSNLVFNYQISEQGKKGKMNTVKLDFNKNLKTQTYYFSFDFGSLKLEPNQNIEYYFSVFDNDKPNGYKESKTGFESFTVPSKQQLDEFENSKNEQIKSKTEKSSELIEQLQKDIEKLKKTLINEKTSDWEKTKMLNEINQKNNELKDLLQEISKENTQKNEFMNTFSEKQEEMLEKQEQIQQLLDELMTDELRELMEQIEQMEKEMSDEKMKEMTDKLEMTYEDLEKQLDRNLELLKRFEVEQKVDETAQELQELSQEQKELSEQIDKKNISEEEALKKQEELTKDLKRVEEKYEKAKELNQDLKKRFNLDDFKQDFEQIENEMNESEQNLEENKKNKASKSMQQSSENMQKLSEKMQKMMQQNTMEQAGEDVESMRLLLKNLIIFSKSQEDLMNRFTKVNDLDPKFPKLVVEQNKLKEDFKIVEDSLLALSKRVAQIDKAVNTEVKSINYETEQVLKAMSDSRRTGYKKRQQTIMTSANNLALLLSEIIQSMQEQMNSSSQSGSNKSKKQKPSVGQMQEMQQSLKKMMEDYLKSLQEGKQGKKQTEGLGKMLAKQEVLKKMMQDLKNSGNTGTKTMEYLKQIEKMMNETENELINRNINPTTIERQQKILDKLLEVESSEREKDKDKERESNESKEHKVSVPEYFNDKKMNKNSLKEDLEIGNLKLIHYYNELYNQYINTIGQ
jgi:Mg2+ and Co2+ transporter CorA